MSAIAWPEAVNGTPTAAVLEQSIARGRLPHSLLLHGEDPVLLEAIALAMAEALLRGDSGSTAFTPDKHPDCFFLRPTGKMRQIGAEPTRDLITRLQVSPAVAVRKVAILVDADRMNLAAANIFLKTLEEPPRDTVILMLSARPYALLPTIRSRVLHFRFPARGSGVAASGWNGWIDDYQAWLTALASSPLDKDGVAELMLSLYALVARFTVILESAAAEGWKVQKEKLPADLEEAEQVAIETGIANGIRAGMFASIARATRDFAQPALASADGARPRQALVAAVRRLEHDAGLLRLNFKAEAALEDFLLTSLRLWARPARS
jgi:DNA polymerase-3 subunit delta'